MKLLQKYDNLEILKLHKHSAFEQEFKCKSYHLDAISLGIYAFETGQYSFLATIIDVENNKTVYSNNINFNIDTLSINSLKFPIRIHILKNRKYVVQICNNGELPIGIVTGEKFNDFKCIFNNETVFKNVDLQFISKFRETISNKIVAYTCISKQYDELYEIQNPNSNIDYICFTDDDIYSTTWNIKKIPEMLAYLDPAKKARCLKVMPHLFLPEYDISLWIDGNIRIVGDILQFIQDNTMSNFNIAKHPNRICTYKEAEAIVRLKKDVPEIVDKQVLKYAAENYPFDNGMVQSGIILRRHNENDCIMLSRTWWNEIFNGSKRDQLSFNYSCWKHPNIKIGIFNPSVISSQYFQYFKHGHYDKAVCLPPGYGSMSNYMNGVVV